MESPDLNSLSSDDERLQAMLLEGSPPLADNGFSARVMRALPPETQTFAPYARVVVCVLSALLGVVFVWAQGVSLESLTLAANRISEALTPAGASLGDSRIIFALAVTVLSLLYAFHRQLPAIRILSKL
jgi:hypothetical protein